MTVLILYTTHSVNFVEIAREFILEQLSDINPKKRILSKPLFNILKYSSTIFLNYEIITNITVNIL